MDMKLINNLPIEIKNKIFLYLSHPCADLIKTEIANIDIDDGFFAFGKSIIDECDWCKKQGRKVGIYRKNNDDYYFLCKPCQIIRENKQIDIMVKEFINCKLRYIFQEWYEIRYYYL